MKSSVLLGAKGTGPNAIQGKVDAEISPESEAAHRVIVNVECQTIPGFPVITQHRWKCGKEVGLVISWGGKLAQGQQSDVSSRVSLSWTHTGLPKN